MTGCVLPSAPRTPAAPGGTVPATTPESSLTPKGNVETPASNAAITTLEDTRWQLVAYGLPEATLPVIPDSIVTVEFSATGEVGGSGGCNTYGGQYKVEGDTLSIGELVSTLRACLDEGVTEQEMGYLEALQLADRFEISDDTLTIEYGEGSGVLRFIPAPATVS